MSAAAAGGSQRNGSSLRDRNMKKTANGTSPGLAFARRKTKEETTRSTRSSGEAQRAHHQRRRRSRSWLEVITCS